VLGITGRKLWQQPHLDNKHPHGNARNQFPQIQSPMSPSSTGLYPQTHKKIILPPVALAKPPSDAVIQSSLFVSFFG